MRWFSALPLSRKLTLIIMSVTAAALVVSGAGFLAWDTVRFRAETLTDLETQAAIIGESASAAIVFDVAKDAESALGALRSRHNIDSAAIYDARGRRVAEYVRDGLRRRVPDQAARRERSATVDHAQVVMPVTAPDGAVVGYVFLSTELDEVWARLRAQSLGVATMFLLAGGAALVLSARLQRAVSHPLKELSQTAAAISSAGDYSLRAERVHQDELGALVDTFNGMLDRIEKRERDLQDANVVLQEANRLKDDFLATLSHELRTPLNAVLGWSRLLRTDRVSPESRARGLETIERNATIQARLIDDLLDISRIIRGKFKLEVEPLDLRAVSEAAIEIVRAGAQAKNISITLEAEPASGLITGDTQRLQQVLWNLLSNAVKFTPPGGAIAVRLTSSGAEETIEVSDTGCGIDPAFLPHVFDLFRQADASSTRDVGGLGLGLAIVRKVIELHGGRVEAFSEGPGLGATFKVSLPRRASQPAQPPEEFAPVKALPLVHQTAPGVRVLLVEDDADSRDLVQTLLRERGAEVVAAGSAAEAMSLISSVRPHVLVSDIAMPIEDGYALLGRIRELPTTLAAVPAVALTAYASIADRQRALAAGFQAFITKPFDPEELVATVRTVARADFQ